MERNFERDLNGMAAEREHNLEEYYAYMAVRVLDGCGAGPCDGEPCVFHFLDSYECTIYVKSEQLEGSYWIRADGGRGLWNYAYSAAPTRGEDGMLHCNIDSYLRQGLTPSEYRDFEEGSLLTDVTGDTITFLRRKDHKAENVTEFTGRWGVETIVDYALRDLFFAPRGLMLAGDDVERLSFVYEDDNGKAAKNTVGVCHVVQELLSHSHDLHKCDLNKLIEWLDEHIDFHYVQELEFLTRTGNYKLRLGDPVVGKDLMSVRIYDRSLKKVLESYLPMGSKNRKQQVRLFLGILLSEDSIEDAIEDAKRQINKMKILGYAT